MKEAIKLLLEKYLPEDQRLAVIDWLDTTHQEWQQERSTALPLVVGVENLLELLGAPGYEFT